MSKPKVGDRYRFASDFGSDPGTIKAGTVAEVVEVVSADTPGAGDDKETSYVLAWTVKDAALVDGEPQVVESERRWAATAGSFSDLLEKEK